MIPKVIKKLALEYDFVTNPSEHELYKINSIIKLFSNLTNLNENDISLIKEMSLKGYNDIILSPHIIDSV